MENPLKFVETSLKSSLNISSKLPSPVAAADADQHRQMRQVGRLGLRVEGNLHKSQQRRQRRLHGRRGDVVEQHLRSRLQIDLRLNLHLYLLTYTYTYTYTSTYTSTYLLTYLLACLLAYLLAYVVTSERVALLESAY